MGGHKEWWRLWPQKPTPRNRSLDESKPSLGRSVPLAINSVPVNRRGKCIIQADAISL